MQLRQKIPKWKTSETKGKSLVAFGEYLTPIGRVLRVEWLGGEVIWHRPVAVEIQRENQVERLPIPNATRLASGVIVLSGLIAVLLISFGKRVMTAQQRRKSL